VVCLGVIAGCASPSLDPVPTVAGGDFLCDGVPREGVELILSGHAESAEPTGTWEGETFFCWIDGKEVGVDVRARPTIFATWGGGTDAGVLERAGEWMGATPLDAEDVAGAGYRHPDAALWVCNGRLVRVDLSGRLVEGRDASMDAANLLVSMLPWACGDEEAPPATVEDE